MIPISSVYRQKLGVNSEVNQNCQLTMDGDHEAEESEKVRSYGIEIDRQKIKSIPENEQSTALKDLGVSVYEQEEFEESVLQQVDDAIEEQKRRISIKAAEKNLQNIKDDIK